MSQQKVCQKVQWIQAYCFQLWANHFNAGRMNIEYVKSVEEPRHKTRFVFVTHEIMAAISLLQVSNPDPELANLTNYNLAAILILDS